jgi:hypothetical protein
MINAESLKINLRVLWLRLRTLLTVVLAGVGFLMIAYGSWITYTRARGSVVTQNSEILKAATAQPMLLVVLGAMFVLLVTYQR